MCGLISELPSNIGGGSVADPDHFLLYVNPYDFVNKFNLILFLILMMGNYLKILLYISPFPLIFVIFSR